MVWPDSLSEWLVEGAGLQQMVCCMAASTARALLCIAYAEFRIQVMVEAVVACPEPEHCHLFVPGALDLVFCWQPCQTPGVVVSELGLVGLVSTFYNWVI